MSKEKKQDQRTDPKKGDGMGRRAGRAERLLRLSEVLDRIPVSRSSWYMGVKAGRYPAGHKIGPRTRVYRESEILAIMNNPNAEE